MKNILKSKAGQMTIIGLFMFFILIVVTSALMPTIVVLINNLSGSGVDSTTQLMLSFIPLSIVIALLVSIFVYARPMWERSSY